MAHLVNAGDLKTACIVERAKTTYDSAAEPVTVWENVFGDGKVLWCSISLKAEEKEEEGRRIVLETAEILCRYSPLVTEVCRIARKSEPDKPWAIESALPMENRRGWMVITAKRRRAAV